VIREAAADVLAEREHALVGDRVVGVVAALRTPDDPLLAEDAEVLGDVLLRRADRVGQLLHARFPLAEQVEQLDPRRVGEHVEAARDQLNQVVGERAVNVKPPLPLIVAPRRARGIRRGDDPSGGQRHNRVVVRNRFRVRPDDRREGRREAVRAPKEVKAVSRKRIVILGGGTGGTMAANRLRRRFDAHEAEIHVVDRDDKHVYQPGLLFVPFGMAQLEEIVRPRRRQLRNGIIFHENEVAEVWTERDELLLDDGTVLPYDLLVVASGVRLQPEETEGLTGPGWNERVFTFYSPEGADGLRGALERFGGGRLVVNLVDMPIKCPVAPLEFAFLADWYLRERGIRSRTELVYATPLDGAFTKPIASKQLAGLLAEKEIELVTEFNAGEVDGIGGKLSSYDGRELEFDLLVTIPLHGGGAYVERSPGLGDALGFVPTDKRTLQTPARPNVFALGDATDLPTSKAGSVTHFEAEVLTENVARYFADKELDTSYDGHANCFIETGFQKALLIDFNYETEPLPGHFPTAFGLPLLRESRLNHLGKLAFQWVYWHALLPGREIPGIGPAMPTAGKKRVPVHAS
jgi:sulfide:quinone oxidoreductase